MLHARSLIVVAVVLVATKYTLTASIESNLRKCRSLMNGCTNFGLLRKYERYFTPACNIHDVCYNCGKKFSISRKRCDRSFLRNMLKGCLKITREWKKCVQDAKKYHKAVRIFGFFFYKRKSHADCKKTCAREIMRQQ